MPFQSSLIFILGIAFEESLEHTQKPISILYAIYYIYFNGFDNFLFRIVIRKRGFESDLIQRWVHIDELFEKKEIQNGLLKR